MEYKFTKGPWYSTGTHVQSAVLNEDNYVCQAEGSTPEEAEANAILISNAPEMLEWLEYIIKEDGVIDPPHLEAIAELIDYSEE